jgi:outer membrane protein assembly factor BamE (lipoprotein component of BamABCDE complex)
MKLRVLPSVALWLFIGCATSTIITGKNFDMNKADKIQKGLTTKQEVLSLLGQPFQRTLSNSVEVWTYQYTKAVGKATSLLVTTNATGQAYYKNLTVMFDSTNVAQSVSSTVSGDPALELEK